MLTLCAATCVREQCCLALTHQSFHLQVPDTGVNGLQVLYIIQGVY